MEIQCADSTLGKERFYGRGSLLYRRQRIFKENPVVCLLESIRRRQVGGFSNSDHPYVNCCGPLRSLVKKREVSREEH